MDISRVRSNWIDECELMAAMIIGEFTYGAAGNGFTDHVTVPAERVINADSQRNNIAAHPAKMLHQTYTNRIS